jgi:signal transduction histidine kinase
MVAALAWWAILLSSKTSVIHDLKSKQIELYPNSDREYIRQQWMIASEAVFFAVSLILGIALINKAFRNEMIAAKQQKNFLLSVTHELKSPITALQLILDTFKRNKLNETQFNNLLNDGKEEAARLNKLVEDLLTAARLSPKKTLKRENVDIGTMMDPLIQQYERNYPDFNFSLKKTGESFIAFTNEASLYLIVSNLLDNAVKYSNCKLEINISMKKMNGHINLSVADNGKGIPEEEKQRIFDQFYRIGDEDIRTATGTGLGLYLVNELCSKLNIKVSVRDNLPEGSIFELLIPIKK